MGYWIGQFGRFLEAAPFAVAAHLTVSMGGMMFLAIPVASSLSAYTMVILVREGVPLWAGVLAALTACALLGVFFAALARRLSEDSFAVFTLASVLAFDALLRSWESLTGGVLGISGISRPAGFRTLADLVLLQGIVAVVVLVAEFVFLQSPAARILRGFKENKTLVTAQGIAPDFVRSMVLVAASVLAGATGILWVWRIQFLDPSFASVTVLVAVLTVAILAFRPDVRYLLGALAFVTFLPEALRFLNLPLTVFGHMRVLLYAVVLILLLKNLSRFTHTPSRTI